MTSAAYYAAHREELREKNRAWYAEHGRDYHQKYRAEHPEQNAKRRVATKAWKKRNADTQHAYQRAYREANRVKYQLHQQKRKALLRANQIGTITDQDIRRLLGRFDGKCAYCGKPWEHLDHVVPLSRGGTHSIGNLLPACAYCNRSKKDKLLIEWKVG